MACAFRERARYERVRCATLDEARAAGLALCEDRGLTMLWRAACGRWRMKGRNSLFNALYCRLASSEIKSERLPSKCIVPGYDRHKGYG